MHRGVAAWRDGANGNALRIFINSRYRLFAIDAKTGRPVESFGSHGVDRPERRPRRGRSTRSTTRTRRRRSSTRIWSSSATASATGSCIATIRRATFARSTRGAAGSVWSFHTIPQPGEVGNDTWGADSWSYTGHTNAWPPMTLDAERGLALRAARHAEQRLLRRPPAGRESVR